MSKEEEKILGFHVYRVMSASRFACSLLPSGAVGVLEGVSVKLPEGISPEKPATVLFTKQLQGEEIQWSSERKCFVCVADNPQCIVLV